MKGDNHDTYKSKRRRKKSLVIVFVIVIVSSNKRIGINARKLIFYWAMVMVTRVSRLYRGFFCSRYEFLPRNFNRSSPVRASPNKITNRWLEFPAWNVKTNFLIEAFVRSHSPVPRGRNYFAFSPCPFRVISFSLSLYPMRLLEHFREARWKN